VRDRLFLMFFPPGYWRGGKCLPMSPASVMRQAESAAYCADYADRTGVAAGGTMVRVKGATLNG
jgi:hypothetical protein